MARRYTGNLNGEKYLGNVTNEEVHNLDNEDRNANGCQIDEIIAAGHARPYLSLAAAYAAGFDLCEKCLTGSKR